MGKRTKEIGKGVKIKEETFKAVLGVLFFTLAILFIVAALDKAGIAGKKTYELLSHLLGFGYFILPVLATLLGITSFREMEKRFSPIQGLGATLFVLTGLGLIHLIAGGGGGLLGDWITRPLVTLFDVVATTILLTGLFVIALLIVLDTPLPIKIFIKKLFGKKEKPEKPLKILADVAPQTTEKIAPVVAKNENQDSEITPVEKEESKIKQTPTKADTPFIESEETLVKSHLPFRHLPFIPIPLHLLENDRGKPGVGDIKANANIIKRTLQNFGIEVEMDEVSIGPSITRYALKPAEGVKLSRIVALQNDLALALAAHPIRIEAPIPGKSLVGIEIPNNVKTTVGLGTLIGSEEFQTSDKPLLISLGKGISGRCHFGNLAKMPHLLIAGATGAGKSVTIHAIITSLLYRNSPEHLRFIMIDPKRVELTLYNKIPHLLTPVITDAKKAIMALKWATKEMERRYDILESESVRDIESYHKNVYLPAVKQPRSAKNEVKPEKEVVAMPYLVIIIDELADMMAAYPRELEASIVRLAQMSRAVGIHLILSTQRPSVNVITGLIKANIPARIALQVASQIDSRTILDMGGAEKLLGAGDMLYLSGEMSQPVRIQSAFISEAEVKKVVKFLNDKYKDLAPEEISLTADRENEPNAIFESLSETDDEPDDDLYEEALAEVRKAGKASTSYLQRRLRIGYARAARLIDLLEQRGIIGAGEGAKPREVLVRADIKTTSSTNNNEAENQNE
jgi:S-DNA-T family DNA segregation ATPase FtsK/SpoIIIE